MASNFDFDRLDPITLEQTLSYLRADPEPQMQDVSFSALLDDAVGDGDWLMEQGDLEGDLADEGEEVQMQGDGIEDQLNILYRQPSLKCTYDGCLYQYPSEMDLEAHLAGHAASELGQWSPPSRCTWKGCASKALFHSRAAYQLHLKRIHTEPLLCSVPRCKHKKPFRNQGDLERHSSTAHSDVRPYLCPFDSCEAQMKAFARKDKWLKHIRDTEHYGDMFCPYPHCIEWQAPKSTGFATRNEIIAHFRSFHCKHVLRGWKGPYACKLGLCTINSTNEHWGGNALDMHLKSCHGIDEWIPYSRMDLEDNQQVLRPHHLLKQKPDWREIKWHECITCSQQRYPHAASSEEISRMDGHSHLLEPVSGPSTSG